VIHDFHKGNDMSGTRPVPKVVETRTALSGPEFYEDACVFSRYKELRGGVDAPHATLEQPVVLAFLGEVRDRSVLDIGCGEAWIGKYVLDCGAARYVGVDGSRRMIHEASRTLAQTNAGLILEDLECWSPDNLGTFDVAVSRLALQYVRNVGRLFHILRDHLVPGGLFVFSIEHPLLTSSIDPVIVDGISRAWRVSSYFREGDRASRWLDSVVLKQHRTLATYFDQLRASGFRLDRFSEGRPDVRNFQEIASFDGRLDVPMCAIFRCVRNA
jgi:trans-aconitate methyltransferase